MAHALDLVDEAAMLLDEMGGILKMKERAEALLGTVIELKTRTLDYQTNKVEMPFRRWSSMRSILR